MTTSADHVRVLIVDDSAIVRHGIVRALEHLPEGRPIEFVGEASTAADAIEAANRLQPDVVLLDLRLPDGNGVEVCRRIRALHPGAGILVFTSSNDSRAIYDAIVAGAHGYLLKEINPPALARAIVEAAAGRSSFSPDVASRMVEIVREGHQLREQASSLAQLTPQERRVLAAMAAGQSNKDIAVTLSLSENTVKNYISRLFERLGVQRRSQAVALFLNQGNPGRTDSAR